MHDSLPVLSEKSHCVFMDNELIINKCIEKRQNIFGKMGVVKE